MRLAPTLKFIQLLKVKVERIFYNCLMKKVQGLPKAFGKVIAEARTRRGMSQEQLAEAIDSTNVYISLLENGQRQPSLNAAILIARNLGMPPEEVVAHVCAQLDAGRCS